jgi:hypothetical protein
MRPSFKATAILAATVGLTAIAATDESVDLFDLPFGFAIASFAITGWLLAVRKPKNSIGWLLSVAGLLFGLGGGAGVVIGRWAGFSDIGELVAFVCLFAGLGLVLGPLLVVFPTGRPPSRRWWWVAWSAAAYVPAAVIGNSRVSVMIGSAAVFLFAAVVGGIASLVVRYRRAVALERQQLKWFLSAAALLPVAIIAGEENNQFLQAVTVPIAMGLLPVAITLAVLRYRLYEIDRIISRTVSYGLVSAVLVGVYLGAVFLLSNLLPSEGELTVAGSTLLTAALFSPVRKRIQSVVDRRFNRSRVDAALTMESLARRLASEVDLSALARELQLVAHQTMQPTIVSVWLR